jgi:hypothetical protein
MADEIIFEDGIGPDGNPAAKILNAPDGEEPTEEEIQYANDIVAETLRELGK